MENTTGFSLDYEDLSDRNLVAKGVYEVIIKTAEVHTFKSGKQGLSFNLLIRNDVDQKYGNRCVFYNLWKRRDPSPADAMVQGYSHKEIMTLAKAAGLADGKKYASLNDLCADLIGRLIRITLDHDDYNDQWYEKVKYVNPTNFPECRHVYKDSSGGNGSSGTQDQFASNITVGGQEFEEILGDGDVPF